MKLGQYAVSILVYDDVIRVRIMIIIRCNNELVEKHSNSLSSR